jgi:glycosyltransferase involved in cell wall biosynthesis
VYEQKPQGHGIALRKAIQSAKHDIVITSDCDNTYPMEFIPRLVKMITEDGYDIISCNRLNKGLGKEMPAMNKFGNWMFAFLVRLLYGIRVHDVTTGMFCMKRTVAQNIPWETNYSFPCEIVVRSNKLGYKYTEIDIPYRIRIGEVTLNKWRSGKAYIRCIFNYRFNLKIDPKLL